MLKSNNDRKIGDVNIEKCYILHDGQCWVSSNVINVEYFCLSLMAIDWDSRP